MTAEQLQTRSFILIKKIDKLADIATQSGRLEKGKNYYTVREIMQAADCSNRTVLDALRTGKLHGKKVSNEWRIYL